MKYKYFLIYSLTIFLFLSNSTICFALELEVNYPSLTSGETITETTRLPEYLKYVFNFGVSIGFLAVFISLIIAGFLYIASAGRPEKVADAKSRIFSAISGMIILLTAYLIITTINPEFKFFKTSEILELPGLFLVGGNTKKPLGLSGISDTAYIEPPKSKTAFTQIEYSCAGTRGPTLTVYFYKDSFYRNVEKQVKLDCNKPPIPVEGKSFDFRYEKAGVYLYGTNNCAISSEQPPKHTTSNLSVLGELQNKINSVKIQSMDPDYYIAVLYESVDFRGRCYYINPNTSCDTLNNPNYGPPFGSIASSVSVYKYEHNPKKDTGVIFYRKSSYNTEGGVKEIRADEIKGIYMGALEDLKFDNVPEEEQDCVEWQPLKNSETKCIKREPPNLAGKNISSIKINGNYFVLFVSYDPENGEWGSCQAFSTAGDVNKEGPKQIKWEYINYPGKSPNYVFIFPVKEK